MFRLSSIRHYSSKVSTSSPSYNSPTSVNVVRRAVNSAVAFYEECIGLAEVHKARSDVTQCEERLYQAQQERRYKQAELKKLQNRLKEIHTELDRTTRGEDRYLHLLTEEHAAIKKENLLLSVFEEFENREREAFSMLSSKVRSSHEREREREERTKYWSILASLVGAFFGILGTSLGNELRMRRFREMLPTAQDVRPVLEAITELVHKEQEQIAKFVADVKEAMKFNDSVQLHPITVQKPDGSLDEALSLMKHQNAALLRQMGELKRLIRLDQALAGTDADRIVYVGDEMETLLRKTEGNLESKMKLQTLVGVVCIYTIVGLMAPLVYFLLKKDV